MCFVFKVVPCERYLCFGFVQFRGYPILCISHAHQRFFDALEELEYPLDVGIADDRPIRVLRVHQGCILEFFVSGTRMIWFLFLCEKAMLLEGWIG